MVISNSYIHTQHHNPLCWSVCPSVCPSVVSCFVRPSVSSSLIATLTYLYCLHSNKVSRPDVCKAVPLQCNGNCLDPGSWKLAVAPEQSIPCISCERYVNFRLWLTRLLYINLSLLIPPSLSYCSDFSGRGSLYNVKAIVWTPDLWSMVLFHATNASGTLFYHATPPFIKAPRMLFSCSSSDAPATTYINNHWNKSLLYSPFLTDCGPVVGSSTRRTWIPSFSRYRRR